MINFLSLSFRYYSSILLKFFPGRVFRKFRNYVWSLHGHNIDHTANLMPDINIICGKINIGEQTFIGEGAMLTGGEIFIGKNCDIAPRVTIHAGSHDKSSSSRRAGRAFYGKIVIGDGVWIGTSSTIVHGAKIGNGVIVAAGSVVIKGVYPENTLIAGCPAKVMKRLDD